MTYPDNHNDIELKPILSIMEEFRKQRGAIIPILQRTQEAYGYLPKPILNVISKSMHIPLSRLYGVATFYTQFRLKPIGEHLVKICRGTACHVRGSSLIIEAVERELGLSEGQDTTPDRMITVEKVGCFGACALAPVVVIDNDTYGGMTTDKVNKQLRKLVKKGVSETAVKEAINATSE
ncbi:MAG: NAD(P)H-dependent oxidoreductase subunit E [Chloroflexota bacterium]